MRIEIVQHGRVLSQYQHEGRAFVEAPPEGEYSIRITNTVNKRRKAIVSVDGINVLDGEVAGKRADGKWGPGYVLRAWETLDIPGWHRGDNKVAKFTFTPQEESYSNQVGKGTSNTGVIGLAVFDEKEQPVKEVIREVHHYHQIPTFPNPTFPWQINPAPYTPSYPWNTTYSSSKIEGLSGMSEETITAQVPFQNGVVSCSSAGTADANSLSLGPTEIRGKSGEDAFTKSVRRRAIQPQQNDNVNLGTGYGQEATMYTQTVDFHTATLDPVLVVQVQYATRTKLISWGVPVREVAPRPSAFPSGTVGVPAPPGWVR